VFLVLKVCHCCLLPNFDVIQGFNPEYMHAILLGVVRQFVTIWFDPSNSSSCYSLRSKIVVIDGILLRCKPPSEIKRLPRSLSVSKFWKASEWRSFLLFYSIVCIRGHLPTEHYSHWLLLVYATHMLLSKALPRDCLNACEIALKFVLLVPELYGSQHVSFNVHLLTHIVQSVRCCGPLWATSAFVFEDANRRLLKLVHGARAVPNQVFKAFLVSSRFLSMAKPFMESATSQNVRDIFQKLSAVRLCVNGQRFTAGVIGVGVSKTRGLSVSEILAYERLVSNTDNDAYPNVIAFDRVIIKGMVLHTTSYSANIKRCDSLVTLHHRTGVFALRACFSFDSREIIFVFEHLTVRPRQVFDADVGLNLVRHVLTAHRTGNLVACRAGDVANKCIGTKDATGHLQCTVLPVFELD